MPIRPSAPQDPDRISSVRIRLASPETIRARSGGEVTRPETIHSAFPGAVREPEFRCACAGDWGTWGLGAWCEACGTRVTERRPVPGRPGHIDLAVPVAHPLFVSSIARLLGTSRRDLMRAVDEGGSAVRAMLAGLDLQALATARKPSGSPARRLAEEMIVAGTRPEWMMLTVLPVVPPEFRPPRIGGDDDDAPDLNPLYLGVLRENTEMKCVLATDGPEVRRDQERKLRSAVVALLRAHGAAVDEIVARGAGAGAGPAARSVVVPNPALSVDRCGLPWRLALRLFSPFVCRRLVETEWSHSPRTGRRDIDQVVRGRGPDWYLPPVLAALEHALCEHSVALTLAASAAEPGRTAVTLAFQPVLAAGDAIEVHPLACSALGTTLGGDEVVVRVPVSVGAQAEARVLMMPAQNVLSPATGRPKFEPSPDAILGCYWMTRGPLPRLGEDATGPGPVFSSVDEVEMAWDAGQAHLQDPISVRVARPLGDRLVENLGGLEAPREIVRSTVGRALLFQVMPAGFPFSLVNRVLGGSELLGLVAQCHVDFGADATVRMLEKLQDLGARHATEAGLSLGMDDFMAPRMRETALAEAAVGVAEARMEYNLGYIGEKDLYYRSVTAWADVADRLGREAAALLGVESAVDPTTGDAVWSEALGPGSGIPFRAMTAAGAAGRVDLSALVGMVGLSPFTDKALHSLAIRGSFRSGLSPAEYFLRATSMRLDRQARLEAGRELATLRRTLNDAVGDTVVCALDCGTSGFVEVMSVRVDGEVVIPLGERVLGRVAAEDLCDPDLDSLLVPLHSVIDERAVERLTVAGVDRVRVRSVLTCAMTSGVCARCYGRDPARGSLVAVGTAVGVIAAEALSARVHGGRVSAAATSRGSHVAKCSVVAGFPGRVQFSSGTTTVEDRQGQRIVTSHVTEVHICDARGRRRETRRVPQGARVLLCDEVQAGDTVAEWSPAGAPILALVHGFVHLEEVEGNIRVWTDSTTGRESREVRDFGDTDFRPRVAIQSGPPGSCGARVLSRHFLPPGADLRVEQAAEVHPGDMLATIPRPPAGGGKGPRIGMDRVLELLDARVPECAAILAGVAGVVGFAGFRERRVVVRPEPGALGEAVVAVWESVIPTGREVVVNEGDHVRRGDPITVGAPDPHELLRLKGAGCVAEHLAREVVLALHGSGGAFPEAHVEIVVRGMVRPGADGSGRPIESALQSIGRAARSADSFLTRSRCPSSAGGLADAALRGEVDPLRGMRSNVLIGRRIPAGSGVGGTRGDGPLSWLSFAVPRLCERHVARRCRWQRHLVRAVARSAHHAVRFGLRVDLVETLTGPLASLPDDRIEVRVTSTVGLDLTTPTRTPDGSPSGIVRARQGELRAIYARSHPALAARYALPVFCEAPAAVHVDALVAILKAVVLTEPGDRMQLPEAFYLTTVDGEILGELVHAGLLAADFSYRMLREYVHRAD